MVYATSKGSDQPAYTRSLTRVFASRLNTLWLLQCKLLNEHHLECVSLKGSRTGSSEPTFVKRPHYCGKSHIVAHIYSVLCLYYHRSFDFICFSQIQKLKSNHDGQLHVTCEYLCQSCLSILRKTIDDIKIILTTLECISENNFQIEKFCIWYLQFSKLQSKFHGSLITMYNTVPHRMYQPSLLKVHKQ